MDYNANNEIIEKYIIQYKHENFLGSGTFILHGEMYEFTWQHYDYQYSVQKSRGAGNIYIISTEPDKLETELFFSALREMIANGEYYKTIS